jgi:ferredoxin-NADP reductase
VLIYGNRNSKAVVFRKELDDLAAASGRLRIVHVVSDDPGWPGEQGRVDHERLARLVPDAAERDVYLCGPPVMMKSVRAALVKLGVPRSHVYFERFTL